MKKEKEETLMQCSVNFESDSLMIYVRDANATTPHHTRRIDLKLSDALPKLTADILKIIGKESK